MNRRFKAWAILIGIGLLAEASFVFSEAAERENVTLSVVAVNPSSEKMQTTRVRIPLPREVRPKDIVEKGDLEISYDTEESVYYLFREDVALAPLETRVFEIEIRDVWIIPETELETLREQAERSLERLEGTGYYDSAKPIVDSVHVRLDEIERSQNDETLSRDQHIGAYRSNLKVVDRIREDIARIEKLLALAGTPPVPEVLEVSKLASDSPTKTTTWMIIFVLVTFVGLLGLVFFITWHRQARMQDFTDAKKKAFPKGGEGE